MANLTVVIPDDVLRRARVRAVSSGTSVNALLRQYLETFAGSDTAEQAIARLLEHSRSSTSGSGEGGRTWRRDDLYER